MPPDISVTVTRLLQASANGDPHAIDELLPLVYDELKRLAQTYLCCEHPGHTLSATALVHEAYLKLVDQRSGWHSRTDFFAVAAQAMRRILVDHARAKKAQKRGGSGERIPLDDEIAWFEDRDIDLVSLDAALDVLAKADRTKARLIELRFFAGLDMKQTAELLGTSVRSAERQWTLAKARVREIMRARDGLSEA